ncbi:hypothetical protein GCM10008097_28460 [Mycetocola manganoxydans]|nr:hypothetical protein GCM10008097_28460 [Mycetocola manganoxydans]
MDVADVLDPSGRSLTGASSKKQGCKAQSHQGAYPISHGLNIASALGRNTTVRNPPRTLTIVALGVSR